MVGVCSPFSDDRRILCKPSNRAESIELFNFQNCDFEYYWYDAAGERTLKESGDGAGVQVNGVLSGARTGTTSFTAYVSPYTVVSNGGQMSKHIYIGSQRIVSKLIDAGTMADPQAEVKATYTGSTLSYSTKYTTLTATVKSRYALLGVTYSGKDNAGDGFYTATASTAKETQEYFYHSDHLGSSSLITDVDGNLVQHIEYIPFGEVFVDERPAQSKWTTPYKFNAKELDEETGLYYYGARYYDPRTSVWLSVDPLAEFTMESYSYCGNNPANYIDQKGLYKDKDRTKAVDYALAHGGSSDNVLHDNKTNDWFVSMNSDGKSVYTSGGTLKREYGPEGRSSETLFNTATTTAVYIASLSVAVKSTTQYSKELNIWRGLNKQIYHGLTGHGPNGATGPRSTALLKSKALNIFGNILTGAGMAMTLAEYKYQLSLHRGPNMQRFLKDRYYRDQAFNAAGFSWCGLYANAASFGYNLGYVFEGLTGVNIQLNPYTNDFTPIEQTLEDFDNAGLEVYGK